MTVVNSVSHEALQHCVPRVAASHQQHHDHTGQGFTEVKGQNRNQVLINTNYAFE